MPDHSEAVSTSPAFDFDTVIDRRGTSSIKWDKYKDRDVIPLWVADMDFRSPPAVIEALRRRIEHGVFGYTAPSDELVEAVLSMLEADYGWRIEPEWLVWLPGLVTGLNVACMSVGEAGDDVMSTVPIYPPFLTAPGNTGRNLVTVPLIEHGGRWGFDFDRLENAITPRTRLFLLCNPHNPSGRVFSRKELSTLVAICRRHDIILCSDEIHCGLVLDEDKAHFPTATLDPAVADRTITLMAPSKTYNIPGLGCSFAVISNARLRMSFRRAMQGIVPYVNALGLTAAAAAYRDSRDWHKALLSYLRRNRDAVTHAVRTTMPGLTMAHVEATYLAWIDTRTIIADDPVRFFEKAGVGLSDGREFGGPGFVRLNFGCPHSTLMEALRRMACAVERPG